MTFHYEATRDELVKAGYVFHAKSANTQCLKHGNTMERWYLPNDRGGVRDYEHYCTEHERTLIDDIEFVRV